MTGPSWSKGETEPRGYRGPTLKLKPGIGRLAIEATRTNEGRMPVSIRTILFHLPLKPKPVVRPAWLTLPLHRVGVIAANDQHTDALTPAHPLFPSTLKRV